MARWEPLLEQVMRERAPRLLAYAAMLTGDDAEAHDVLQDALVRTFSRGRRFDHVNQAEAYVRRAIPSVVIDRSRKFRPVPRDPADHPHVAAPASDRDAVMDVRSALRELTPRERACVVLRFYDDLTVAQIAAHLGSRRRDGQALPVRCVGEAGGPLGVRHRPARRKHGARDGAHGEGKALT